MLELDDEVVGTPRSRNGGALRSGAGDDSSDVVTLKIIDFSEPFKFPSTPVTASPLTELVTASPLTELVAV